MRRILLSFLALIIVFLFAPFAARAADEKEFEFTAKGLLGRYLYHSENGIRRSDLDIKNINEFFYMTPNLMTPKEIHDYHNAPLNTEMPADMKKVFNKAGVNLAKDIYNNSDLSLMVNRELAEWKKSLESKGLGFLANFINPELRFDYEKDSFWTRGYKLREPIVTETETGFEKDKYYAKFGVGIRGFKNPSPKLILGAHPFRLETEYIVGKNEIKFKLFELAATNAEINYTAKAGNLGKGQFESHAAILKVGNTGGKIFFSGRYNVENKDAGFFVVFIKRF